MNIISPNPFIHFNRQTINYEIRFEVNGKQVYWTGRGFCSLKNKNQMDDLVLKTRKDAEEEVKWAQEYIFKYMPGQIKELRSMQP